MFTIDIRSNIASIERKVNNFAYQQIPFATARALNALGRDAINAEKYNEVRVLDRPKPFTQNALRLLGASKSSQHATIVMMDKTAKYLEPYEFGGDNVLNGKALLKPIAAAKDLDKFGNLPRGFLEKMKGRTDVFFGRVQTKAGSVSGIWQRSVEDGSRVPVRRVGKNGLVKVINTRKGANTSGKLTLLVRFTDAHPVKQKLGWFEVAERTVNQNFDRHFGEQLALAMLTAK